MSRKVCLFFSKTHTGNLLYKSLVKSVDLSVSEDVDKVISFLCNDSIKNQYIDLLDIDKSWMLQYLSLVSSSEEHRFTDLYNRETDDIKWDQVLNNVVFNSEQLLDGKTLFDSYVFQLSETVDREDLELFSSEEMENYVELLKKEYYQVVEDFPEYDKEELACKLGYYAIVQSNKQIDSNAVTAITEWDKIVTTPYFNTLSDVRKPDTMVHENLHMFCNSCVDKSFNYLSEGIIPSFIKEGYASLYTAELNDSLQTAYLTYDEAIDLVQAALALGENYQVDNLLRDLMYQDIPSFLKEFPTYGVNTEEFYLDNIKSLFTLNLLLDSDCRDNYSGLDYTVEVLDSMRDSVYKHFLRIYLNNLVILNDNHPEMTQEDNAAFISLYWKLIHRVVIDNQDVISLDENIVASSTYDNMIIDNLELNKNNEQYDYLHLFFEFLANRYGKDVDVLEQEMVEPFAVPNNYQFPDFLGEEKKNFYNYLYYRDFYPSDYKRPLVKQK